MKDKTKHSTDIVFQGTTAKAVVPNDTTDLTLFKNNSQAFRDGPALYVGGGGDLRVLLIGDTLSVLFTNLPAGSFLPIQAQRVFATDTSCTGILEML